MKTDTKRLCDRKMFNQSFSFEAGIVESAKKNVQYNGDGLDISSCGLGMQTGHALDEGSILKFYLPMREFEITVPVYAQVMWSMPANDRFRVGVRFLA